MDGRMVGLSDLPIVAGEFSVRDVDEGFGAKDGMAGQLRLLCHRLESYDGVDAGIEKGPEERFETRMQAVVGANVVGGPHHGDTHEFVERKEGEEGEQPAHRLRERRMQNGAVRPVQMHGMHRRQPPNRALELIGMVAMGLESLVEQKLERIERPVLARG